MVNRQGTIDEISLSDDDDGDWNSQSTTGPTNYRGGSFGSQRRYFAHKEHPSWASQVSFAILIFTFSGLLNDATIE